jgi:hypothetical protein
LIHALPKTIKKKKRGKPIEKTCFCHLLVRQLVEQNLETEKAKFFEILASVRQHNYRA